MGASDKKLKKDRVWVCRGCCCGTRKKHPGFDHEALELQARTLAEEAGVAYRVTDCLGPCGKGNVVVVRHEGRTHWFRGVNDARTTEAVLGVVRGGEVPRKALIHKREGKKP